MSQVVRLFNNLTLFENVEAAALAHGHGRRSARDKARELLAEFGLERRGDDLAIGLSYGDKRRVEIEVARTEQLMEAYELAVLVAFGEVEDALAAIRTLEAIKRDTRLVRDAASCFSVMLAAVDCSTIAAFCWVT